MVHQIRGTRKMNNNPWSNIKHIVVLMMENRSFDNLLGWLYAPDNKAPFDQVLRGQRFEGLAGLDLSNPVPEAYGGGFAVPEKTVDMIAPNPNPNEPYVPVYTQLFGLTPPPDPIPNTTETPTMDGFVMDYAGAISDYNKKHSSNQIDTDPRIIMAGYAPDSVPVIAGLARAYGVCDHWFSSAPTETFPNRSFVHAGTSSGNVINNWKTGKMPWDVGVFVNKTPTVFNLLEDAGVPWKVYHGEALLASFTYLLQEQVQPYATNNAKTNRFFHMEQFIEDAAGGNLPAYSFIEPRYFPSPKYGPENDNHPAYQPDIEGGPSNVLQGELLTHQVYEALRNGKHWENTLFILTYDEHGGCYDHVPPPLAVPPDNVVIQPSAGPNGSGFTFNRLGVRVPTVLVSPFIEEGTVIQTCFDHTSIIKTVLNCFGLQGQAGEGSPLGARVAAAVDIADALNRSEARTDRPMITPRPDPGGDKITDSPLIGLPFHLARTAALHMSKWGVDFFDWAEMAGSHKLSQWLDKHSNTVKR
jgi:phospholipase C